MRCSKIIIALGLSAATTIVYAQAQNGVVSEATKTGAQAQKIPVSEKTSTGAQAAAFAAVIDARAAVSYWTAEKMANTKSGPIPTVIVDSLSLATSSISVQSGGPAVAGYAQGCLPGVKTCNTKPRVLSSQIPASSASAAYGDLIQPMDGAVPINPQDGPYGPFQRWREANPITAYPKSTIGKLFFTLNGQNYVCSASVINVSTVITAGHCNSDGAGNLAINRVFCPSYNGGENAGIGCWPVIESWTSGDWHTFSDPDYDYSCLVMDTKGTKVDGKIGNTTGWLGIAWNFPPSQAERTFGYPQASPFNGETLQTTASTDWYTYDFTDGNQISKIIGSDLTGGSSGGPWILGWTGGLTETADTDGSEATDPGTRVLVNGVNSHRRCLIDCNAPTATSGIFSQEMSSPPFRNTVDDLDEAADVIAKCFEHPNNNP